MLCFSVDFTLIQKAFWLWFFLLEIQNIEILALANKNKQKKYQHTQKNVESLVSFSPTGYCKKSVLLALSYINCLSKDFVHIQFLQYFKLISMLLFLWKVYEQNKHFLKEASFLCIIWNDLNDSPISDPHQKIQVGEFFLYFLSKKNTFLKNPPVSYCLHIRVPPCASVTLR